MAMGIHATFAGLALGLQPDMPEFLGFLFAILAHKWAEAMTIGISFAKANTDFKQSMIMITISAFATPIGTIAGILVADANDFLNCIMMGVSAGTFIYIACAEIIIEEFSVSKEKLLKFFMFIIGMCLMIGIFFVEKYLE